MPRPKVRPEDRRRSRKACLGCKASKIRCDAQSPCSSCVRRNQAASCTYSTVSRRGQRHSTREHSDDFSSLPTPDTVLPTVDGGTSPSSASLNLVSAAAHVTPCTSNDSDQLDHGFMANKLSEKVSLGETSSRTFLHFLRKTVRAYIGAVAFTDGNQRQAVIETEIRDINSDQLDISPEKLYSLIDSYFEIVCGLLDLFEADEIDTLIANKAGSKITTSSTTTERMDAAALDVALAIGTQGCDLTHASSELGRHLFNRARQIAFEAMLTEQSVSLVRLYLLLTFYMLGDCHRNAASMYLGVSARAALVLGLHNPSTYKHLTDHECAFRLRTWNSLQIIDVLTSFILGTPKNLPVMQKAASLTNIVCQQSYQHMQPAFGAILRACSLLEEIVEKLSRGNLLHVPTSESLLEQLRDWSSGLSPSLLHFSFTSIDATSLDIAARQSLTGNMHVACVYYFAVTLITRPFLIAYLLSRLRGRAPDQLISDPEEASDINIKNNKVSKLAQVCVSSAMYMAKMCYKVKISGFQFANLCLLQAWIFGAGLVLGFSMFAGEPRSDIDEAFRGASEVLDAIAVRSPQARQYHEILASLSDAVKKFRSQVSLEVRRAVQHYMNQLLVIDLPHRSNDHHAEPTNREASHTLAELLPSTLETSRVGGVVPEIDPASAETLASAPTTTYGGMEFDWGSIDPHFLLDPMLDIEPFQRLFCTIE